MGKTENAPYTQVMNLIISLEKGVSSVFIYWISVFWNAIASTWGMVFDGWQAMARATFVAALAFFLSYRFWGKNALLEEMKPWLSGVVAVAMVAFVVFLFQLVVTPVKMYAAQKSLHSEASEKLKAATSTNAANDVLIKQYTALLDRFQGMTPQPTLTSHQVEQIRQAIKSLSPRKIIIEFSDAPFSRARPLAESIGELFKSEGWYAEVVSGSDVNMRQLQGVMLKMDAKTMGFTPEQRIVFDALNGAGLNCGQWQDGAADFSDGRIELKIGQQ